jgi:hypothetical protein
VKPNVVKSSSFIGSIANLSRERLQISSFVISRHCK